MSAVVIGITCDLANGRYTCAPAYGNAVARAGGVCPGCIGRWESNAVLRHTFYLRLVPPRWVEPLLCANSVLVLVLVSR